ncbi:hypothetical protein I3F58_10010 [Streptomyces sp. MUM 203J]|uniref:DUF6907 domain-containing protein n=1 Tax=Streptomyces sp. MUM 203J TaxID=2791990 RepID=UPI001F03CC55|nr:hypothetical protein [Streptomyces sp. MUM 203J]MCH0539889.1 hypothetical protein [Streptomyces sp. MUM 203J]
MSAPRTVTVHNLDHGPTTVPEPTRCRGHDDGAPQYPADVIHTGPPLSLATPSWRGPAKWLHAVVDAAPHSARERDMVVVELGGGSYRYSPEGLRELADDLTAQLHEVRAFADTLAAPRAAEVPDR